MTGIPLIRMMVLLPKGGRRYVPPSPPPPPGTSDGVTNEGGQVVVNEDGDAPISGDETPPSPPDLIVNGDFLDGTTDWGAGIGGSSLDAIEDETAPSGAYLELTTSGAFGSANQMIATEAGQDYELTVWVKNGTAGGNRVSVGTSEEGFNLANENYSEVGWSEKTILFTATGTETWIGLNLDFGPGTGLFAAVSCIAI